MQQHRSISSILHASYAHILPVVASGDQEAVNNSTTLRKQSVYLLLENRKV